MQAQRAEEQPFVVPASEGSERTIYHVMIPKVRKKIIIANDTDGQDEYILGRRVLRFRSANLAAFHLTKKNFNVTHQKYLSGNIDLFLVVFLFAMSWFGGAALLTNFGSVTFIALPAMGAVVVFATVVLPLRYRKFQRLRRECDAFRQSLIAQRYPEISLKDIGDYALLPDQGEVEKVWAG